MARVQLELPETFLFCTDMEVRIGDINFAGHLSNDAVLVLLHEARIRFLAGYGLTEMDIFGFSTILADVAIVFRSEAFQGEVLRIEVSVTDFNKYGCDYVYRISEKTTGREVARAKTGIVFFDYQRRSIERLPQQFQALFEKRDVTA
jgi:acyl-CoA thioester hydrolase